MTTWLDKKADTQIAAQLNLKFALRETFTPHFVTISREYGCDGRLLAAGLQERLNQRQDEMPWHTIDRAQLLKNADPNELNEERLNILEEYGHSEFQGYLQEALFGQKSQLQTIQILANMIRVAARRGHVILLGAGASVLTQDYDHAVHIRLFANKDWRAENHAQRHNLTLDEGKKAVEEQDAHRYNYLKTYLSEDISNRYLYDIMIDNAKVGTETAIDLCFRLICEKLQIRKTIR
ncbi:cytidylate kinase-like family protein [Acanthopleuribacter pedis]|uniref:Cytidylate kinase-like family protein n=1 Tax=Acanthopleuribacter pedis TaxID=442870 RepID=A0A8J7QBU8_9BACT|nr:cytidylate kinase-like family protein [Acanthopleuribacter pedis]MBO1321582.1 cytidylate kinase-like family protein [Acanthopleuribacter pedis]